jgi:hypothetical protein
MKHTRWPVALVLLALVAAGWLVSADARLILALLALLIVPGFLLERWLLVHSRLPLITRSALWPALGLSTVAVLYQWAAALGMSLAPVALQGTLAICLLAALGVWLRQAASTQLRIAGRAWIWPLVLALVLALTLWTRFAHIRELAAPAWVDSLHHALLIRVAAEQGHAPYALEPLLPIERLAYHSGFHSFVAAVLAVCGGGFAATGADLCATPVRLPEVMLPLGQMLNALAALGWAGAAALIWRQRSAAVTAALVVGLASIMPAYYVSWGRYTLVAGMLLLPGSLVALTLAFGELRRPREAGPVVAAGLLLAGLSLVHFVALCLALLWGVALVFTAQLPLRHLVKRGLLLGGVALGLTLPWYAMLVPQIQPGAGAAVMHVAGEPGYNAMPVALLWAGNNALLAALAGCAAFLALLWRRRVAATIAVWWALVVLAANPVLLGLPYLSFFTNEFVAITLFAPLALLIAGGAAVLETRLPGWRAQFIPAALAATALWLALHFQSVVRPDTVLANAADLRAVAWAARHTPPDARFVVNTAGWLYDVDRGADGGWWLAPLAGRAVSTPPVVFTYGSPSFVAQVKQDTSWLRSGAGTDPTALAEFMRRRGYSHVFATRRGTSVDPERLRSAPEFIELHRDEDVTIFVLRR